MSFIYYADCEVTYDGRAQSELERGHYLLLFKDDGSVLVHGSTQCVPLNYMGPGTKITHDFEHSGYFLVTCRNKKECLIIKIYETITCVNSRSWSDNKIKLVRTEAELRDKLVANLSSYIPGYKFVSVISEVRTEVGPCDVMAIDDAGCRHIIEVKRASVSIAAVVQVRKYTEAMGGNVIGYVAAPDIKSGALAYAAKHSIVFIPVFHECI